MEITGVQAVGARSLGSVSATVSDSTLYTGRSSVDPLEPESTAAALRTVSPEAVAFPRDGKPLDRRPVQLRQDRAHTRYLEDGGGRSEEGD
ncbi:MAG: hypothetical protein ACLPVY_02515 [Acidimicrobiia bacterium]